MIYIVTASDLYYPCEGAEDWELVTRDLEGAKVRARELEAGSDRTAYVLAINEDNLHAQEVDWRRAA
jgi:hypothetical protein